MHANKQKMNAKKLMVSFMAIATVMFLVATVSAATELTDNLEIKVNDDWADNNDLSVIAGETLVVKAMFNSLVDASDVTVKVEIEGNKVDSSEISNPFDVEAGLRYSKTLRIEVPYELKDEVSDDASLIVTVKKGSSYKTVSEFTLRVQRPSYNADIMSIVTPNTVEAGEAFPVDIVLKNIGYNNLDDVYVSAKLSALNGVERTVYFGDLVSLESEDDDDEETTVSGRITLQMPFDAEAGIYVLDIEVSNDDFEAEKSKQIIVENDFPKTVVKAGNDLLIVNPTSKLKVYKVVFPDSEQFVTVGEGSSKTVQVMPNSEEYTVSVLDMNGELIDSFTFNAVEDTSVTSPVVILTIILAIVFLVLLVVLIVLIGKKPERTEEFGESYY
jgi:hypothetical protein